MARPCLPAISALRAWLVALSIWRLKKGFSLIRYTLPGSFTTGRIRPGQDGSSKTTSPFASMWVVQAAIDAPSPVFGVATRRFSFSQSKDPEADWFPQGSVLIPSVGIELTLVSAGGSAAT